MRTLVLLVCVAGVCACDPSVPRHAPRVVSVPPPVAAPSPAPPSEEPIPPELFIKRITAVSVRERLPELVKKHEATNRYAISLAIIEEAIERASADMFVRYVAGAGEVELTSSFTILDDGHFPSHSTPDVSEGGLTRYGASTRFAYAPPDTPYLLAVAVHDQPLPDATPGLVWSVGAHANKLSVELITLDGEHLSVSFDPEKPAVSLTVPPPDRWPPPVPAPAFGRSAFTHGTRTRVVSLDAHDDAFVGCVAMATANATAALPEEEREIHHPPDGALVRANCKAEVLAWEKAMAANIEASIAERKALYDKAKARYTLLIQ